MFSRDKAAEGPQIVEVTLEDGRIVQGKILPPPGRTLIDTLNGSATFIEFEPMGGQKTFLAKSSLRVVRPLELPPNPTLTVRDNNGFNPAAVLGIAPDADKEEVRQAYLHLAKIYHPDRYATIELPPEVREYLAAMARRINAAHDALNARLREQAGRAEPVFTRTGRS